MTALALTLALLAAEGAPSRPAPVPVPTDPVLARTLKGKTVLVLGDSMIVTGFEIWIRAAIHKHGGIFRRWSWASSTTRKWANSGVLERALRKYHPDIVLILLGSNELYLDHPEERARHVKTIVRKLGKRPFWWLSPPVWGKQTGIVDVIRRNVPRGRFYPFNHHKIARMKDGHHPSPWGARTWAYDFVRWWIQRLKATGH